MARRDGAEIFDIVQGFVSAAVLGAVVELGVLRRLLDGPATAASIARQHALPDDRTENLLQAAAALGFLKRRRDGRFAIARKGAAILGVPGLEDMIRHNRSFYADMADPVALMRGEAETNMARFWPYVFGSGHQISMEDSERYSTLMARSQVLVAEDTLRAVRLSDVNCLMDVGGGAGVFLAAALGKYRRATGIVFDLPGVQPMAEATLARSNLSNRARFMAGSFRDTILPTGADAISLVRVLYDHDDDTVRHLLSRAYEALPANGRLIISEPMSGGASPDRSTDVYFAFYTMAMGTGRVRSAERIGALCAEAGFSDVRMPRPFRQYVTSVVTAVRNR